MNNVRRLLPYGILALLIVANVTIFWQRQALADWWVLRNYAPPIEVSALASDTAMTPEARHLFYVNRPELESREDFNRECGDHLEQSIVLGCYHGDRQGIHLYNVTDPRLAGIKQVTAAHEMLHQAYDRLNPEERSRVDKLLNDFAQEASKDERLASKLNIYRKSEPDALNTEMHSIFGTELRNLPLELEEYYKQYFTDRSKVVSFSEAYENEFTKRGQLVADYDTQLRALDSQIDANKGSLDARLKSLNQKRAEVERSASEGNAAAYQANVIAYNRMVAEYNHLVDGTRSLIDQYNQIVAKRNEIAVQEQELRKALDSRLTPALQQ